MILVIDNYDSFTYNLARYVRELGYESVVYRNDAVSVKQIAEELQPSHIIISPGPCTPTEAGISVSVVQELGARIPILGVCLGHQAIGAAFGAEIVRAKRPLHGRPSSIWHDEKNLFQQLDNPFIAGRYHSLVIDESDFPAELEVTARSKEGEIMAVQHRNYPIFGVQFHVESVLTDCGYTILRNFLRASIMRAE